MLLIFLFSTHPTNFQKAVGRILTSEYVDLTHTLILLYILCSTFAHADGSQILLAIAANTFCG
jgi:hypothetical protein